MRLWSCCRQRCCHHRAGLPRSRCWWRFSSPRSRGTLAPGGLGFPIPARIVLSGSLIGIAVSNALIRDRSVGQGVHWPQVRTVLEGLAFSPVLGFVLAGGLYFVMNKFVRDSHLYKPIKDGNAPVWWVRGLLVLTCTGGRGAHGSKDGQKRT